MQLLSTYWKKRAFAVQNLTNCTKIHQRPPNLAVVSRLCMESKWANGPWTWAEMPCESDADFHIFPVGEDQQPSIYKSVRTRWRVTASTASGSR